MNKNFFVGGYGWDKLSYFLAVLGAVLLIFKYSLIIGLLLIGYSVWRVFSRDFDSRRREGIAFELFLQRIKNKYNSFIKKNKRDKNYVVVKCPKCSQKLRLPRKKGNIVVTCKSCRFEFKMRT